MSASDLGFSGMDFDVSYDSDSSGSLGYAVSVDHPNIVAGCGCGACEAMRDASASGTKDSLTGANPSDGYLGTLLTLTTNPDGSRSFSGDRNVDATLIGSQWGTNHLTYSFPTSGTNYNGTGYDTNGVSLYHIELGAQQQASARAAFAQISSFTNLTFTEITETDSEHANIRISQSADADVASAYGGFPSDTRGVAGDIWFGRTNQPYYDLAYKGTWGNATMMHEIGHTMGLKHGHQDYTNSDLSFYFGTSPRYGSQSLTADKNGQAWSLMTYTPAPFTNSNFAGEKVNQPQSYMQYDIAALQYMYGANFNTNNGDSVYTFSQTTGEMFINGVGQGAPSGNTILLTIWDGGGNDTIDASNYAGGVTIDLRPGQFSTLDTAQLANHLAYQNLVSLAPGNIAMSLLYNNDTRSLIENAKGGAGNDVFAGNVANNVLDGGLGSDTVVFTNTTGVTVTLKDDGTDVIVTHDGETDTLRSIENIGGTKGDDTITGNSEDNVLTGGSGGNDVLVGGAGNDVLVGSSFTATLVEIVDAPSKPDITKAQATNNNSIANAVDTTGAFDADANPAITNATTLPHATINAVATGGALEYYRIEVTQAGAQAIFDIDGNGTLTDSFIELVNSAGVVLAVNDTGTGDAQPAGHDDAYLTYTFATPGVYYIRVGQWVSGQATAQPLTAGQTYQLNISLQGAAGTPVYTVDSGSAVLDGGLGDDLLIGTVRDDVINGGDGNDTASFANAFNGGTATGVTVDLNVQGVAQNTVAAGTDTLIGIENLIGSNLNDTLTGDGNANIIEGGAGNDTLVGGGGIDTASYAGASAGVNVSLALQGGAQVTGAGTDTLSGFENLLGSAYADQLTGDANANVVTGGAGNDTLNPGANLSGAIDTLDGGAGSDTASFAGLGPVTATLGGASDGTAAIAGETVAILRNIENLLGGAGADTLTGDDNANVIDGGAGNDTLVGGGGVDTLSFASNGAAGITVNLATLTAQVTGAGTDTISGFENVRGTSGADNITGDAGDNTFFEAGGADVYNGAGGSDTLDYSAATSTVTVNLSTATAQNTGAFGGIDTITNMENVIGAAGFANALTGNAVGNRLVGGSLNDTLIGNNGADTLVGGAGNDIILGGTSASLDDGSADVLEGGLGNDFLSGGQGNDTLRGGDGDDSLLGGVGNTAGQFFTGVDGGDDSYDGGNGFDTAIMVYDGRAGVAGSTVGISFNIGSLAGNSDITFNGAVVGTMSSIERVTFRGTQVDDNVVGGGANDSLTGLAGNDVLNGWLGNDTLSGGLGNDTLIGGDGLDTATYANSTAGVTVDLRIVGAQDTGGEGIDTLVGIEYLTGSSFGDTLRGNDGFNLIIDSVANVAGQVDALYGYGGNDSLLVTRTAAAPATTVLLDGGEGDDLIELRAAATVAPATFSGGLSTTTYLSVGAVGTRFVDTATVDGGAGNDRIILTSVLSATINAGSGNDLVSINMLGAAGTSQHTITLGSGQDQIFCAGAGVQGSTVAHGNIVTDFGAGDAGDKIEMTAFLAGSLTGYVANSDYFAGGFMCLTQSGTDLLLQIDRDGTGAANGFVTIFTLSNAYTGGLTAYNFDGFIGNLTLTGFDIDETIIGATGNDVLGGGGGNDTLIGLAGNDRLDGGTGADTLIGGTGDDYYVVDNEGDESVEAEGEGTDTEESSVNRTLRANVENLILAGVALVGAGNALDNHIVGNAENNELYGNGGVDTLDGGIGNDLLDGGTGADVMTGGVGNDHYRVDEAGDQVIEAAGEGRDAVTSSINYTLGANVEDLTLVGGAVNGTGNALDNSIFGNGAMNILDGGDGNDIIYGGDGNDTIYGGGGNDTLYGGAGSDRLFGGSGNDVLIGGDGTDFMTGGAGFDRFVIDIGTAPIVTKAGTLTLDVITDFSAGDRIDLSGIDARMSLDGDQAFSFGGSSANKAEGQLTFKVYDSINGAEKALGMDIDGVDGPGAAGPVTVVFGNVDGGTPDFAIALLGVAGVNASNFIM